MTYEQTIERLSQIEKAHLENDRGEWVGNLPVTVRADLFGKGLIEYAETEFVELSTYGRKVFEAAMIAAAAK